jgi:AraC-like DNA-binding protein
LTHDPRDSVRAAALAGMASLITRHRGDADSLLMAHGFTPQSADDPEKHVSYGDFIRLMEDCSATLDCPHFGLQLAQLQDLNVLGPVATIIRHSRNVAEAVNATSRYVSYHTPGAIVELVLGADGPAGFTFEVSLRELRGCRQINELSLYLGKGYRARQIHFANARPAELLVLQRTFGSRLEFDMPINRVILDEEDLLREVEPADPALRNLVARYIDLTRRDPSLPVADRVSRSIRIFLPSGRCSLQLVAEHLGHSTRTLQRELAMQGRSFRELQEAQQEQLAKHLLANTSAPLLRVATLTGFSEQSTFSRAFRRWTGKSPGRWRREIPGQSAAH